MNDAKRQRRAEAVERLKNITLDPEGGSHEHLSAICGAIYAPSYGWTHGACDGLACALIDLLTDDGAVDDCGQVADMSQKGGDCVRSEGETSETDTREKLEADVFAEPVKFVGDTAFIEGVMRDRVISWLDRQAAITESECLIHSKQGADALYVIENAELQDKLDELTDEPNDELAPESGVSADAAESNDAISEYLGQSRDSGIDARECQPIRDLMDECAELERTVGRLTEENDALREWKACYERACAERDECADAADRLERRVRKLEGMLPPLIASDGQPIERGETLYGLSDCKKWTVTGISHDKKYPVLAECRDAFPIEVEERALKPRWLSHGRPDSLERALADLRRMADFLPDGNWQATAHGIAERIEKLAKEGA